MSSPLQIEFHNTRPVEAVESRVREELAELEKFYNRLVSCRVDVEAPEHEHRGSVCKVRIDFGLAAENVAPAQIPVSAVRAALKCNLPGGIITANLIEDLYSLPP